MKKGMIVMTIVIVLSFLVSLCAVAPAVAAQATKTSPTSKQQAAPSTQIVEQTKAKDKFWDIVVDHFIIKGNSFAFANDYYQAKIINVTVGETVNCQCFYKVKTITIGDITKADASYWGSGNSYKIAGGLFFPGPPSQQEYKIETRKLPKFTYADVQLWKNQLGINGKKEWNESLVYSWTAKPEHVGKSMYLHFSVDSFLNIKETDEQNNGNFGSSGLVAKFTVIPYKVSPKDIPKETLEKNK